MSDALPTSAPADRRARPARSEVVFVVVAVVLAALHLVVFFANYLISPIGFDEGFILQAPSNLVQGNGYSTEDWLRGGDRQSFDAIVSTGPAVGIPIAASFLVFGVSIEAARIVMLPFLALLVVCLFVLGRRIAGRWAGLAAAATVLALNTRADWPFTIIYGSSDALGEYAAAALIALALVLLPKRPLGAGIAIGFAALAKFIAFMAAPAFVVALILVAGGLRKPGLLRRLLVFAAGVVAPSVAWEVVKLISLGPAGYGESLLGYLRFVFRSGSGIDGSGRVFFLERAARLFAAWHLPTVLAIVLGLLLIAVAVYGFTRYWSPRPEIAPDRFGRLSSYGRAVPVEVWAAIGTLTVFAMWWSFVASSIFIRHTMPVLLACAPILTALAVRGVHALAARGRPRAVAAGALVVAFVGVTGFQLAATTEASFRAEEWTRAQQIAVADFIREQGFDEVQGVGWWAAPEVRFLSNVPSTPIGTGHGPLVIEPITARLEPGVYEFAVDLCEDVLYEEDGFIVCTVSPDVEPLDYGMDE